MDTTAMRAAVARLAEEIRGCLGSALGHVFVPHERDPLRALARDPDADPARTRALLAAARRHTVTVRCRAAALERAWRTGGKGLPRDRTVVAAVLELDAACVRTARALGYWPFILRTDDAPSRAAVWARQHAGRPEAEAAGALGALDEATGRGLVGRALGLCSAFAAALEATQAVPTPPARADGLRTALRACLRACFGHADDGDQEGAPGPAPDPDALRRPVAALRARVGLLRRALEADDGRGPSGPVVADALLRAHGDCLTLAALADPARGPPPDGTEALDEWCLSVAQCPDDVRAELSALDRRTALLRRLEAVCESADAKRTRRAA